MSGAKYAHKKKTSEELFGEGMLLKCSKIKLNMATLHIKQQNCPWLWIFFHILLNLYNAKETDSVQKRNQTINVPLVF